MQYTDNNKCGFSKAISIGTAPKHWCKTHRILAIQTAKPLIRTE